MKHILALLFLCFGFNTLAQYNKEKLTNILTNGNTKNWSVKGTNFERPEKTYEFNKNGTLNIGKNNGQGKIVAVAASDAGDEPTSCFEQLCVVA